MTRLISGNCRERNLISKDIETWCKLGTTLVGTRGTSDLNNKIATMNNAAHRAALFIVTGRVWARIKPAIHGFSVLKFQFLKC